MAVERGLQQQLVEAYELLREQALARAARAPHGLAIVLEQGVAVWMEISAMLIQEAPPIRQTRPQHSIAVAPLARELVETMAQLILTRAGEAEAR